MIIKSIHLENIRSYINEIIVFPEGAVVLAGDIGAGKTTILLSVEFALFGIMKGDVLSSHLLRHGTKEGSVTLTLNINNNEIIIKRTLKRNSSGIGQESGYLIVNGKKTDMVSKELKARILSYLGYSNSMLNSSKSLIYRYTVYTPQEDMKKIILSTPEERLNTLRNIFGIDKYKTIKENITLYSRELKRNIAYMQGQLQDLDEVKARLIEKRNEVDLLYKIIIEAVPIFEKAKNNAGLINKKLEEKEKELEKIRLLKNNIKILITQIENTNRNINQYEERLAVENNKILILESEINSEKKVNEEKLIQKINAFKQEIFLHKNRFNEINKLIGQYEYKKVESIKLSQKITSIDKCPVCLQVVDKNHKHNITLENQKNVVESEKNLSNILIEKGALEKNIVETEKKKEDYENIQKKYEILKLKTKLYNEKKEEVEKIIKRTYELKKELGVLANKRIELELDIKDTSELEKEHAILKQDYFKLQNNCKDEEIKITKLNEQKKYLTETISSLNKQVDNKEKLRTKMIKTSDAYNWINDFFENLMVSMEKNVFAKIYYEFNDLVSKWFFALIGDESINLRLNNEFTPILEQNGYETEIDNLSGGEKTAVALSYRLALNKVINDVVSSVNTKDLIILDEPTDGFSSEQLDRVKEVIDELNLKQIIIVSHESKIEGFVDNVIRIVKHDHESKVLA